MREKENIDLATQYEIELESVQRELYFLQKNNEVIVKEKVYNLELKHSKEKRSLLHKISSLEKSILRSGSSSVLKDYQ